jgi:hypothetical protein
MLVHVDLVAVLFIVWGALTTIIGLSTLALSFGAAAIISSAGRGGGQFAAGLLAAFFATAGVVALVWGVVHMAVGLPLQRRRPWARIAALTLGTVDLALLPYGTGLGIYALWVLLGERGREAFLSSAS